MRLVIPWMVGVFCGDYFFDEKQEMHWCLLAFCFWAFLTIAFYTLKRHTLRWCFGVSLTGFCFMGGWVGMTHQLKQSIYEFSARESVYRVLLTGKPEQKERSYLCRVIIEECQGDSLKSYSINKPAILYLQSDSLVSQLKGGEQLLVFACFTSPKNEGNFDEFDYARYLLRKGMCGTGYAFSGKWKKASPTPNTSHYSIMTSFRNIAASYREKVLSLYCKLGFRGDELAVLSALTIGDKTELSESVREDYSISGASHVLALSGLHIGLLYALLFFCLKPMTERWRAGRCVRSILLILLLWAFAFFTGLSSSVVRSVCMFSILAMAELFRQQAFSLNTLAVTAFLMLLCNPVWLFDVGFQLSFLAVMAILLIQPPIYYLLPVRSKLGKYVWGLVSVSIAAQLGTAPLVLYYFSHFSMYFLLTNLVVIPLVTTILYLAVLMFLLTPLSIIQESVASIVYSMIKILNDFTHWVGRLPYASIGGARLYPIEALGIYFCLFVFLYYLILCYFPASNKHNHAFLAKRNPGRVLLIGMVGLFVFCSFHVFMLWHDRPRCSFVFYNVRHCPVVHCVAANGNSWLVYGDSMPDKKQLCRAASNYWKRHHLQVPIEVKADYENSYLQVKNQILSYHNNRVCIVNDNRWRNKVAMRPLVINYLYLCRGYKGTIKQLTQLFSFTHVILDASLPQYQRKSFSDECKLLDIVCHSLSMKGALCFQL